MKTFRVECSRRVIESCTVQVQAESEDDAQAIVRRGYQESLPGFVFLWRTDEMKGFNIFDVYEVKGKI